MQRFEKTIPIQGLEVPTDAGTHEQDAIAGFKRLAKP